VLGPSQRRVRTLNCETTILRWRLVAYILVSLRRPCRAGEHSIALFAQQRIGLVRHLATHISFSITCVKVVPDSVSWITTTILFRDAGPTHVLVCRMMFAGRLGCGICETSILRLCLLVPSVSFSLRSNVARMKMWAWSHSYWTRRLRATARWIYLCIRIRLQYLGGTSLELRVLPCTRGAHTVTRLLARCAAYTGSS
jgi:hypothetical protein